MSISVTPISDVQPIKEKANTPASFWKSKPSWLLVAIVIGITFLAFSPFKELIWKFFELIINDLGLS